MANERIIGKHPALGMGFQGSKGTMEFPQVQQLPKPEVNPWELLFRDFMGMEDDDGKD